MLTLTKKNVALGLVVAMCSTLMVQMPRAFAAESGDVVINEIAWAGSIDSANDEWIELYNNTSQAVDLSNWTIVDDDGASTYTIAAGAIPANGYFLIEKNEAAVSSITADAILPLSLANTGDKLVLRDGAGNIIDIVNGTGGAWYAGNSTTKATMERIDSRVGADLASNWGSNQMDNGATSSAGSIIPGTPKGLNSLSSVPQSSPQASLSVSNASPVNGDTIVVTAGTSNMVDLFAYGFDVTYDNQVLKFLSAQKKGFLNENGNVLTSFQAGLENGQQGKVLVAEARTVDPKTAVSGDGDLFEMSFEVIGAVGSNSAISIAGSSFLADMNADIGAGFSGTLVTVHGGSTVDPATNLVAVTGTNRYEIDLNWQAPANGADSYNVYRKDTTGNYLEIGNVSATSFTDKDGVSNAGNIVPELNYAYKVVAVKGANQAEGVEALGQETRGIKGDNNRSDRVDGRDLESLARHFAETTADAGFDPLKDTTYDGIVDGGDLLDLTAKWAVTYVAP